MPKRTRLEAAAAISTLRALQKARAEVRLGAADSALVALGARAVRAEEEADAAYEAWRTQLTNAPSPEAMARRATALLASDEALETVRGERVVATRRRDARRVDLQRSDALLSQAERRAKDARRVEGRRVEEREVAASEDRRLQRASSRGACLREARARGATS